MIILIQIALCVLLVSASPPENVRADEEPLLVFAAASLGGSLDSLASRYMAESGTPVLIAYGASGTLVQQIRIGADVDLFISADEAWMDRLEQRSLLAPGSRRVIAGNRLVLIAPSDSPVKLRIAKGFPLARALGSGRLAMADPAAVPAGRYARAALEALGVWAAVEPRVVRSENVRAALALVERGEAPLGIVYATDAVASRKVRVVGVFPASSHPPIRYPAARLKTAKAKDAPAFLAFLGSRQARVIFARHGFSAP